MSPAAIQARADRRRIAAARDVIRGCALGVVLAVLLILCLQ